MRVLQELQLGKVEGRLVEHQPGPPDGEQPVDGHAPAGLGHGGGGAGAGEQGQQDQVLEQVLEEGVEEPLGDQGDWWRRRWW